MELHPTISTQNIKILPISELSKRQLSTVHLKSRSSLYNQSARKKLEDIMNNNFIPKKERINYVMTAKNRPRLMDQ
jgi:hypothetical protein